MENIKFDNTEVPDIIELKGIDQSYDGGQSYVIKGLDLLLENEPGANQVISLLGASGCGKSTLLRYVCGLQKPTCGEVKLYGKPIDNKTIVGMVFQKYSSLPWLTVKENIAMALEFQGVGEKERNEKAVEMIKLVGLAGHENKYAEYPTLSGGQLQRVAIARSLLANPKILLMDEPFGALDINTRLKMQELLMSILQKIKDMAIIFVTHSIDEAVYLSHDIYLMSANPGKIVCHYKVPFKERDKELKRTDKFTEMVYDIEDEMVKITSNAGDKKWI
jgi:NitT/TauT family transport system ATP-binding protein